MGTTYLIASLIDDGTDDFNSAETMLRCNMYTGSDPIPVSAPGTWLFASDDDYPTLDRFHVEPISYDSVKVVFDEIRIGTTWDEVIMVIPEPSTFAMLLGGLGLLGISRRSRTQR